MGTQAAQPDSSSQSIDEAVVRRSNAYVMVTAVKNYPDNR